AGCDRRAEDLEDFHAEYLLVDGADEECSGCFPTDDAEERHSGVGPHPTAVSERRRVGTAVQLDSDRTGKRLRDHGVGRASIDQHSHGDGLITDELDVLMKLSHTLNRRPRSFSRQRPVIDTALNLSIPSSI